MNISQMSAFQAVMTSATLSDAARKLGRTQPAVSAAIKTLEDQLGVELFKREGRKLIPVPEAQYLLTETEAILNQLSRVHRTMRSMVDGQTGHLNIAAMPGPVAMLFPSFVANQIEGSEDIKVSMYARSSRQIAELARAQSIDFGFADAPDSVEADPLYLAEYITADCFVAIPEGHTLKAKKRISLSDLSTERMGSLQSSHAHQREVRDRFVANGFTFRPMVESQTFLPILQFVGAGQCCAILDPLTVIHLQRADSVSKGIHIKPLTETFRYQYAIFTPRYRPASVLANRLRDAWREDVMKMLTSFGANPECTAPI